MTPKEREETLEEIVERELAMFQAAPNEGGPASCQQRPDAFRLMRRMAHSAHGDGFLQSYLEDLRQAEREGRNFMIEKYARMDERLPPLSDSPMLDEIADAESAWLVEAARLYPQFIRPGAPDSFRRYLRGELETLSPESLELYAREIREARETGRNPVLERHIWLAKKLGRDVPLAEK